MHLLIDLELLVDQRVGTRGVLGDHLVVIGASRQMVENDIWIETLGDVDAAAVDVDRLARLPCTAGCVDSCRHLTQVAAVSIHHALEAKELSAFDARGPVCAGNIRGLVARAHRKLLGQQANLTAGVLGIDGIGISAGREDVIDYLVVEAGKVVGRAIGVARATRHPLARRVIDRRRDIGHLAGAGDCALDRIRLALLQRRRIGCAGESHFRDRSGVGTWSNINTTQGACKGRFGNLAIPFYPATTITPTFTKCHGIPQHTRNKNGMPTILINDNVALL